MRANQIIWVGLLWACVLSVPFAEAQTEPVSGLYQIVGGTFTECCGIAGENRQSLPNLSQGFVLLSVDSLKSGVTMTFLGKDGRTMFSVAACPPGDPINFRFDHGGFFSGRIIFHVDPGPPPNYEYWNYTVSNTAVTLRIDGGVGISQGSCADFPTQFSHSNVVAVLVPPPRMRITEYSENEGALLFIQGNAFWTNIVEASADLVSWSAISTNVMPGTLCPICPYILVRDVASTNLARRFYRCFEIP